MDRLQLLDRLDDCNPFGLIRNRPKWVFVADDAFAAALADTHGIGPDRLLRIADLPGLGPERVAGREVAVICTNGSEDLVRAPVTRQLGLRPLRLFADLVLRRAARAELRGGPDAAPDAALSYAIFCLPRCGSTLLAKELELLGLGRPTEHLRASTATLLRHRDVAGFDMARWWALVRAAGTTDGVFGTKVLIDFLLMASDSDPEAGAFLRAELGRLRILRIIRRNKVDQAVSDHLARRSGVWHLWNDEARAGYAARLDAVETDLGDVAATYRKFVVNEARLDAILREDGLTPIDIDYDALAADPKQTVRAAVEALGRPVPDAYLATPVALEPTRTPTHTALAARLTAELGL